MDNEMLAARLNRVFQNIFDEPSLIVTRDMTANDVEGWDSLTHINLIVATEREFGIKFTTAEVTGLSNVGELIDIIQRKTGPALPSGS